jgi:predicted ATP-dependent protease
MTPEQEQWLIRAVQELQAAQQQNQQVLIQELREGQAMLAQFFREALDRFDERTIRAIERRTEALERRTDEMAKEMREMRQEIRDLRRDFLERR